MRCLCSTCLLALAFLLVTPLHAQDPKPLRAGIIGLDTSHVTAFTKLFNDPKSTGDLAGIRIVAAFPAGSPDLESSRSRIENFTKEVRGMGVEIVDSIPALLEKVDVVLLESVDGRPHLEQARPVLQAGKPLFIDKPLAASLADSIAIAEIARKHNTPWFSSSSLRFSPGILSMRNDPKIGDVIGCDAFGPCPIEPTHPDLFWYGIHGVEILFTIMGPGCQSVQRTHTQGADLVTGVWADGRIGTFRGIRAGKQDYGAMVFGAKAVGPSGSYGGYKPLCEEIARFFKTRKAPVSAEETLQIIAFMAAADESRRQNGAPVKLQTVMDQARKEAAAKLD